MKKLVLTLFVMATFSLQAQELDYQIEGGQFVTSEGAIPSGCLGQLMTEFNGGNSIAAVYITRNSMRGCIRAEMKTQSTTRLSRPWIAINTTCGFAQKWKVALWGKPAITSVFSS
ncbi:hypothetical protein KUW04_08860 [Halomonas denitrificans]|nr:hypothetical protein [Halomonas denitrificans]